MFRKLVSAASLRFGSLRRMETDALKNVPVTPDFGADGLRRLGDLERARFADSATFNRTMLGGFLAVSTALVAGNWHMV